MRKKDPILEKLLAHSKKHLETLISEDGKEWFKKYNDHNRKKEEALLSLLHEIQQYTENTSGTEKKTIWETIQEFAPAFPSIRMPAFAYYGNNDEEKIAVTLQEMKPPVDEKDEKKLTVKMEPIEDGKQKHLYHFQTGQEVKFFCTLAEESYILVLEEDSANQTLKLIAPDEETIKNNVFQAKDFEKLPMLKNQYNLFNYQFDQKGKFYWRILAVPHLPWGEQEIEKEDLLYKISELLKAKEPCIVLEINVS